MTLATLIPVFGASFEGPAQGSVIAGPEVFSTEEVQPGGAQTEGMPSVWPVPDWASVQNIKRRAPAPRRDQDALISVPPPAASPSVPVLANLDGLAQTQYDAPDPAMAAGFSEVVEVVNSTWAVFDKAGNRLFSSLLVTLFLRVNPPKDVYQAQVCFDAREGRWVISALARNTSGEPARSVWLLAVSQDSSALGRWWVWKLDAGANGVTPMNVFAYDQALGYNDKLVVLTANMFDALGNEYKFAKVRVFDKAELYRGLMRTYFDFWGLRDQRNRPASSVRPMRAPQGAGVMYLASVAPDSGSQVTVWQIAGIASPTALELLPALAINHYDAPPDVPQRGSSVPLATGPAALQCPAYRNGRLYCVFHEAFPAGAQPSAGIRYLAIAMPPETPGNANPSQPNGISVVLDRTIGNGKTSLFNPSVSVDGRGNAYLVFNYSAADQYPGVACAGWKLNSTLTPPSILKRGEEPFVTGNPAPFGRFTAAALDPYADNVSWFAGAFGRKGRTWGTTLHEVSFDPLRARATVIHDHQAVLVKSDSLFKFGQNLPHWNAVGLRSTGTWHLETWDANFTTFHAISQHDPLPVILTEICVADGNHGSMDTMGARVTRMGSNRDGMLQFSQSASDLDPVSVNGPFRWRVEDVVQVFDYPATPNTDTCFTLSVVRGNMDLGMAIFQSAPGPYYASRYEAVAMADENGPGQGEYLTFKPTVGDNFAVVAWSNNAATGEFSLSSACRVSGEPNTAAHPGAFGLSVADAGLMGEQAVITYDVPKKASIGLRVFDSEGRVVRTLAVNDHEPGQYRVTWDGHNANGQALSAGTYFVRLSAPGFNGEQKIVKMQ